MCTGSYISMCDMRTMSLSALGFGLLSLGALSLSVSTDYWLFTAEPVYVDADELLDQYPDMILNITEPIMMVVNLHSGLWRACTYYDDLPEEEAEPSACNNIGYFQTWERVEGGDTTNEILRSIRRASPVVVISHFILIVALGFATVGNARLDMKTLVGAVFYIFSALSLSMGVIFYISAVNDEVAHRKKPENPDEPPYKYQYGWAFFFTGGSFIGSMFAAVTNISLYVRRYPNLEDMVNIIPGLEKKSNYDFGRVLDADPETDAQGNQNPTIIL